MRISLEHIDEMAKSCKLLLNEKEKVYFCKRLNEILEELRAVEGVDLDLEDEGALARDSHLENPLREDRVLASMDTGLTLKNAPKVQDHMFEIPGVLE